MHRIHKFKLSPCLKRGVSGIVINGAKQWRKLLTSRGMGAVGKIIKIEIQSDFSRISNLAMNIVKTDTFPIPSTSETWKTSTIDSRFPIPRHLSLAIKSDTRSSKRDERRKICLKRRKKRIFVSLKDLSLFNMGGLGYENPAPLIDILLPRLFL